MKKLNTERNILNNLVIELNDHKYKNDTIYVTIAIKNGFLTNNILINDDNKAKNINCASSSIFVACIKLLLNSKFRELSTFALGNATYISFKATSETISSKIIELMDCIFINKIDDNLFEKAKATAINNFRQSYMNTRIKASFKIMEFSDNNKSFSFGEFASDLANVSYSDFLFFIENVVNISNSVLFINGDIDSIRDDSFLEYIDNLEQKNIVCKQICKYINPYLKEDKHLIIKDKEEFNVCCLSFDFLNKKITNMSKQLLLSIISVIIFDDAEVFVDDFDASIIAYNKKISNYKKNINNIFTDDNINMAKDKIIARLAYLLDSNPIWFNIVYCDFLFKNISLIDFIDILRNIDKNLVEEIFNQGNIKICEGQLIYLKEV